VLACPAVFRSALARLMFLHQKVMGNKSFCKIKYDRTQDNSLQIEQRKELYRRKKQEHANIEERNDDNVNRDFQQEEVQPGMHAHMMIEHTTHIGTVFKKYKIQSIEFKFKIL
jgi:hypothetical protein